MGAAHSIRGLLDEKYKGADPPRRVLAGLLGDGLVEAPQQLPNIEVTADRQAGDDAHDFVQQQLKSGEPQLPQRDVQAEFDAYRQVQGHLPGAAAVKAFGALPDLNGGVQPGVAQELYNGDYQGALSDLLGVALGYGVGRVVKPIIWPKGGKNPPNKQKK